MRVEDLLDRFDRRGPAGGINGLVEALFLVAGKRLAQQVQGLDHPLYLGRERLELDVGDGGQGIGAARRACRSEAGGKRQPQTNEPGRSETEMHGEALKGRMPRCTSRMAGVSPIMMTAPLILTGSARDFNKLDGPLYMKPAARKRRGRSHGRAGARAF